MDGCLVTMNGAAVYGGGVDNFGGIATIHHSTISGNSAKFGGGIENSTGGMLTDRVFDDRGQRGDVERWRRRLLHRDDLGQQPHRLREHGRFRR